MNELGLEENERAAGIWSKGGPAFPHISDDAAHAVEGRTLASFGDAASVGMWAFGTGALTSGLFQADIRLDCPPPACNAHAVGAPLYQPQRAKPGTATPVRTFLVQCFADVSGYGSGQTMGGESMADKTVKKVEATSSPSGEMGQKYLASGKRVSMRLWEAEPPGDGKPATHRDYETVGYVIGGRAELHIEGQLIILAPGDSWLVPAGAKHRYRILEPFTAVEATAPPAQVHARDRM